MRALAADGGEGRPRIRLVAWRPDEAAARARSLAAAGFDVQHEGLDPRTLRQIRDDLPDAVYGPWVDAAAVIWATLASPPAVTTVPKSLLDGYSGTPLHIKLGIKEGMTVLLAQPSTHAASPTLPPLPVPDLGALPAGARITHDPTARAGVIVWPVRTAAELHAGLPSWVPRAANSRLWIAWPRKTPDWTPDVNQNTVRQDGLDAGLVDYKIVRVDEVWSAGAFAQRKPNKKE